MSHRPGEDHPVMHAQGVRQPLQGFPLLSASNDHERDIIPRCGDTGNRPHDSLDVLLEMESGDGQHNAVRLRYAQFHPEIVRWSRGLVETLVDTVRPEQQPVHVDTEAAGKSVTLRAVVAENDVVRGRGQRARLAVTEHELQPVGNERTDAKEPGHVRDARRPRDTESRRRAQLSHADDDIGA